MFDENHLKSDLDEGGRVMDSYGYVMIKKNSHPYAQSSGYIKEHRLVMEVELGRYLTADEIVHHINRDKSDNRPENLEVVSMAEHRRIHNIEDKIYESKYDLELIRELYLEGYSTRKIAEMIGIGKSTVGYYVRKWGISRTELSGAVHINNPLNERQISDDEINDVNRLRREGVSVSKISNIVGYSRNTIYKYLDDDIRNIPSKYNEISDSQIEEIYKHYYKDNMSQKEIAKMYGSYGKYISLIINGNTKHFRDNKYLKNIASEYKKGEI